MKKFLMLVACATLLSSCTTKEECTIEGRWVLEGFDNTLYEFTDSLQYTIYSTTGTFGTIADALPNPHVWVMDGDTIDIDLNFGNHLRAYPVFDCDCNVLEFVTPTGSIAHRKEGTSAADCQ